MILLFLLGLALVIAAMAGNLSWRWGALGVGILLGVGIFDYANRWPFL